MRGRSGAAGPSTTCRCRIARWPIPTTPRSPTRSIGATARSGSRPGFPSRSCERWSTTPWARPTAIPRSSRGTSRGRSAPFGSHIIGAPRDRGGIGRKARRCIPIASTSSSGSDSRRTTNGSSAWSATPRARAARLHVGPESADRAIGCERCHGPGGLHVAAVAARFSDMAIANPAQARAAEVNQSCGGCHGQHSLPMPASRTAPDWTRFPGSTLPWSRCYVERGGALSCVTCHDPHRDAETSPAYYEAKCLACHASPSRTTASTAAQPQQAEATRRSSCPINPSRDCLGCHMPKVEYDWLHGFFTDHYIRVHRSPGP